jgi:hypothetical protein
VTHYRWRQEFGGLKTEQVKRLKDLELENSRVRKAVSDLTPLGERLHREAAALDVGRLGTDNPDPFLHGLGDELRSVGERM